MDFSFSFSARENRYPKTLNATTRAFRTIVLAGLVAIFATLPLLAQSPSYPDFSSVSGLVVNPTAPPHPIQVNGNVLRIKPPMCLTKDDADFLVDCLNETLGLVPSSAHR